MIGNFREYLDNYKMKRWSKIKIDHHSNIPKMINRHKDLKKYSNELVRVSKIKNKLIYDTTYYKNIIGSKETQFSILMLRRNQDFFEGIIFSLWHNNPCAIFPIMRALVEDLFLLKYVEKNPDYITKYMEIKDPVDKQKQLSFLKNKCSDKQLKKYYAYLCNHTHPNPVAIKFYLLQEVTPDGKDIENGESTILLTPTCNKFYINSTEALIRICNEELIIINKIILRNINQAKIKN